MGGRDGAPAKGVKVALTHSRWRSARSVADVPFAIWAAAIVVTAYAATLARSLTRWDSGEFLAAVYSLGIPHPPGTPLYVLMARAWSLVPWPLDFVTRVNLFSAVCGAAAVALLGVLLARWTGDKLGGFAATLCAGCTATLWLSATEAEVYAPALLFAMLLLWIAARREPNRARVALLAYVAGLGWALHLTALLTLPAAIALLVARTRSSPRAMPNKHHRTVMGAALAGVLGASAVVYLLVRAQHDPAVNQGNPANLSALWDVLTRAQYAPPGFWPRRAPMWLQLGNWFEYADWQFGLGLSPEPPAAPGRTAVTILFAAVGVFGSVRHRSIHRQSWLALLIAFLMGSLAAIAYLNLRAGPSFGAGVLPAGAMHEARERDYFFILSFVIWGAWAGYGAVSLARSLAGRFARPLTMRVALAAGVAVAALPLILNFPIVARERLLASELTRADALSLLVPLPDNAVFLAWGDNDTYPLWYLQTVESRRPDVTVVTVPLLGTHWYRKELVRRHRLLAPPNVEWRGLEAAVVAVCRAAASASRPILLTPFAPDPRLALACRRASVPAPPRS